MLYGKFSNDITNSVIITDTSHDSFELFLEFIYTGDLKLKNDEIKCLIEIGYCAQKYLIDELRKKCLEKLTELLNRDNIFKFLEKSFEFHLEDFLVSCLYFVVDEIEAGTSFCNAILNNNKKINNSNDENSNLSSKCFEFLIKNLLDYFGDERDDILCLVKAWTIKQCHVGNTTISSESLAVNTKLLNFDASFEIKFNNFVAAFVDISERVTKNFHRQYYKPVRPLILERNHSYFDVNLSFRRFISIKSLTINSRLTPENIHFVGNQTYIEKFNVEIFDKSSGKSIYKELHTIDCVAFNESFKIKLNERMILFPYTLYKIRISWNVDETSLGSEYPRQMFSLMERDSDGKVDKYGNPMNVIQFHEYNYCYISLGSIVQGICYDVIA